MKRALLISVLVTVGCETVDEGSRGIKKVMGKVEPVSYTPGFYTYNPFTTGMSEFDVREQKLESKTTAYTKDNQSMAVDFILTYYPDPAKAHELYIQFGNDWADKIVMAPTLGAIKDTVGKNIADNLVGKREEIKNIAYKELEAVLAKRNVIVTRLDFINIQFDASYEKASEAKVVAIQKAEEAKNHTVEVQENAKQQVISAQAAAESMRIRSQALQANQNLVEYEAVQKWDGKLPQYMLGNSVPFLNLNK